jgi:PAS domain S-box-containing protein
VDPLDFRKLFESAAGLYVVFDRELRIVAASDAYLRATGTRREQVVGQTLFDAFPENPHAQESAHQLAREMYGRVFAGGPPESLSMKRYDVPRKEGGYEERYWDVETMPVPAANGRVAYVMSRLVDVTVREERYRELFKSIDAGFCVIEMIYDSQGNPVDYRFLETNPAFERQTGLQDAPAKTMREHAPAHEAHWFETSGEVARPGAPARFVQPARGMIDGWFEVYAYRVGGPGSRRVAILFNDISVRVRAERALRDADRRKDEFIATLSHELRNPLAPIRNALAMLRMKDAGDPDLRFARETMERQVLRLVRLVDDLLDISRITFGKLALRRQRVDLRGVAEEAAESSRGAIADAGHHLAVQNGPQPLWVDGDPVRLGQVVANLLSNAVRYTPAGGRILLATDAADGLAELVVQDNGAGIPADQLESIFEAFAQAGEPGAEGGLGIGLTLSRKLVELHGGTITAQSEGPGRGSRFVVRLPRVSYVVRTSANSGVLSKT